MNELNSKLSKLNETDFITEFHKSLVSLYPTLTKLECLENDTQPYDDFDEIAECLWNIFVCKSIAWKYGIDNKLEIGKYGFEEIGKDGYIEIINNKTNDKIRFIEFIGNREYGNEPFNAIRGINSTSKRIQVQFTENLNFKWKKA
jgi:hypothetical protein